MGKKDKGKGKRARHETAAEEALVAATAAPAATDMEAAPAEPPPPPEPVDVARVATRLNTAAVHLLRRLHKEDASRGVSSTRMSALSVLVLGGPRTLGQLADAEGVTAPSMTRLVTAMETDGLVERTRTADDGRLVIIRATDAGAQLLHRGRDQRVDVLAGMLRDLPDTDQRTLDAASAILEDLVRPARRP